MDPHIILALVVLSSFLEKVMSESHLVRTDLGEVIGKTETIGGRKISSFLGVPYGLPPVGELRFKKPRPVEKYSEPINATSFGPGCYQIQNRAFSDVGFILPKREMSEDCLRINIWTRLSQSAPNEELRPVLVWFYGGGFLVGWSSLYLFQGEKLASLEDVVVVTLNYRVGALGFITAGTKEEPGNLGLYDQLCALKWIKKHIHHFGGDPDDVTLFGESAGSISVAFHMISPFSRGLFKRGILESGTSNLPLMTSDVTRNFALGSLIAFRLKCLPLSPLNSLLNLSPELLQPLKPLLDCMRRKSPEEINEAEHYIIYTFHFTVLPTIGEAFLPLENIKQQRASHTSQIEIIMGVNGNEGSFNLGFIFPYKNFEDPSRMMSPSETEKFINEFLLVLSNDKLVDKYTRRYFEGLEENDVFGARSAFADLIGDWLFHCPAIFFADIHSSLNPEVYYYNYTHVTSFRIFPKWMGVAHQDEIPFVFGLPFIHQKDYDEEDRNFSRKVMDTWSNFAKGKKLNSFWPRYSSSNPQVKELRDSHFDENSSSSVQKYRFCYDHWKPYFDTMYAHILF